MSKHLKMRQLFILSFVIISTIGCKQQLQPRVTIWEPYDESQELKDNADHESRRMQYKLIQSKILDKNIIWKVINKQIADFTEEDYNRLKPIIFEKDILSIQSSIENGDLTYRHLTQWYLFRILKYESDKDKSLHSIIAINPNAVKEATALDKSISEDRHPIYGMPILLKDNINTDGMPTTAGAHVLEHNNTDDAFIVKQIKSHNGIILGKVNLSEWAYFFCSGCPLGYSAIGGQSLNPYGRKIFETGGSSAGSGTTMAANYAAAAIGTETSGSIVSPSSQNSIVGLKPSIGLLSRSGIVPISSTLDTPGPMTRTVTDNAILLSAVTGEDASDAATKANPKDIQYYKGLQRDYINGLRLGAFKNYMEDSLYVIAINDLKGLGAEIIELEPEQVSFSKFVTFLNADMQRDFPKYMSSSTSPEITISTVKDVVNYNLEDTLIRAPYGQTLFEGVVAEEISDEDFEILKADYDKMGKSFFNTPMDRYKLDAVISINNYNSGHAAMAKYPCLTVPMGYEIDGQPKNVTFIAKTYQEDKLLKIGYAYEQATQKRKTPENYKN